MRSTPDRRNLRDRAMKRRDLLRIGGLSLAGLNLADISRSEARRTGGDHAGQTPPVTSCILLFQPGGPSHLDTWDMKPNAPLEIRGEFNPTASNVPGFHVCEHFPRLAKMADKLVVIRSMHHRMRDHNAAAVETLSGHTPLEGDAQIFADHANSYPCFGSALSYLGQTAGHPLPAHVSLPHVVTRGVKLPGQEPGFLGPAYGPFQVSEDINLPNFRVAELLLPGDIDPRRLNDRQSLRRIFNERAKVADHRAGQGAIDEFYERAFTLLGSDAVHRSLDISQEDPGVRDRYGRNKHGQSVLLARRLVEAGVRFVTVNFAYGDADIGGGDDWDTHFKNFGIVKDILAPPVDQAFSALIEDLEARGLARSTLVVWLGEFGRTPRITKAEGGGRDHWPDCFSMVLAGGGAKGGTIYGSSDKWGAFPDSDPVSCGDLAATLFWRLGLDPATLLHDRNGRPIRLAEGDPLTQLFV